MSKIPNIIEDEAAIRSYKNTLKKNTYQVEEAEDGVAGLEK
jgi:DNA-binding response OmpR family regulator